MPASEPDAPRSHDADADWASFSRLTTLINHWDRPGWTPGRRSYHWIIRFDCATAVRELARRCQQALSVLPTLDATPLASLHLTLQRVAFTNEVDLEAVAAVAAHAARLYATIEPFTTVIGPLAGSRGAIRFSATPHEPIRRIRDVARDAIAAVRGLDNVPARSTEFVPHVSVAYNNAQTDARPIIREVTKLRSLPQVKAIINSVDLVELRRDGRTYVWQSLATLTLGTEADVPSLQSAEDWQRTPGGAM